MDLDETDIESFIDNWPRSSLTVREAFRWLLSFIRELDGTKVVLHGRPGISYSLRAANRSNVQQPLFALVDVIDDEPRWLSVCFYGQAVTDPAEKGNLVPGGLLGEDGLCFDIEEPDDDLLGYLAERLIEAYQAAR